MISRRQKRRLNASSFIFFVSTAALAQALPDAGQTLRQLERPDPALQAPRKDVPALSVEPERAPLKATDGLKVHVKGFRVTGASVFSGAELGALLADLVGKELPLADLESGASRITRHYRERGYLVARAYLPAQEIKDGMVEVAVLEGRIGRIDVRNQSRLDGERAQGYMADNKSGEAVSEPKIERGLLLLADTPGVGGSRAALQPGASVGLSDLIVDLEPGRLATGSVDYDNHGNRYTGRHRLGGTLNLNSPLGLGDIFTARAQVSDEDLAYARLAYQLPIGTSGFRLGVAWSENRYHLGKDFSRLHASGDARTGSLFATYPFVRSRTFNLSGAVSFEDKELEDRIAATATRTNKSLRLGSLGVTGDGLAGASLAYTFGLAYTGGQLDIETPAARAIDAATARSHGHYDKLSYNFSAAGQFTGNWSLFGSLLGQEAGKNLDSSEKFSLGGASGVRAYPQGEATGDEGHLLTAELRYLLPFSGPGAMQASGFVDTGRVRINKNEFAAGDNARRLSAAGLGLTWNAAGNFLVKASLAWKVGNARALSDQDRDARFWLQAVKYF